MIILFLIFFLNFFFFFCWYNNKYHDCQDIINLQNKYYLHQCFNKKFNSYYVKQEQTYNQCK
jgi:hypothetical protein